MTATAAVNGSAKIVGGEAAIQSRFSRPLAASAQVGARQFATAAPATGYASLNDGTVPGQIAVGIGDPSVLSDTSTTAGNAAVRLWQGEVHNMPASTATLDGFTDADLAVPFYIADENTPGKLSNRAGNNRTMGGLVLGLFAGMPVLLTGLIAWLLARAAHVLGAIADGRYDKAIDAGATTDLTEVNVSRARYHGTIARVDFVVTGTTLAASGATNYKTMTLSKRDGAGGSAVVVATVDTQTTAFTQWTAVPFTLSVVAGAIDILETDILTIQESHAASGAIIPAGSLRVFTKVG